MIMTSINTMLNRSVMLKEIIEYVRFCRLFNGYYSSEYQILETSECIYRSKYYNEENEKLVRYCKSDNFSQVCEWYEQHDSDLIYEDEYYHNRMSMRIIAKHIMKKYSRGTEILDVACGHGEIDIKLASRGYSVTSIDLNKRRIEPLKTYVQEACCVGLDSFKTTKKYDIILSLEMLEHVIDIKGTLGKIKDLLKPGGCLYITVPNELRIDDEQHVRIFSEQSLISLVESVGFKVIAIGLFPYLNHEKDNDIVCVCSNER